MQEKQDPGAKSMLGSENETVSAKNPAQSGSESLVPGTCNYCSISLKKPWDVIVHLVEEHEVVIRYVQCGDGLPLDADVVCYFCGHVYATPEDTYFHVIVDHGHYVFGRGNVTDFCCVEMITPDKKSLKLKAKIKANPAHFPLIPPSLPLLPATSAPLPHRQPMAPPKLQPPKASIKPKSPKTKTPQRTSKAVPAGSPAVRKELGSLALGKPTSDASVGTNDDEAMIPRERVLNLGTKKFGSFGSLVKKQSKGPAKPGYIINPSRKQARKQKLPHVRDLTSKKTLPPTNLAKKRKQKVTKDVTAAKDSRALNCILCGSQVGGHDAMVGHLKTDHSPPFNCPKCSLTSILSLTELFDHVRTHFGPPPPEPAPKWKKVELVVPGKTAVTKRFQCLKCSVQLESHESLKSHARVCSNVSGELQ